MMPDTLSRSIGGAAMARSCKVIDADGHILEPPNLWENYIDSKYLEVCPKLIVSGDGDEIFRMHGDYQMAFKDFGETGPEVEKEKFGRAGAFGAREGIVVDSAHLPYAQGRRGGFDPHARIVDMDTDGIDAAFLYPTLGLMLETNLRD